MKCSYCGKKIDNNADVCPYCGMIFNVDTGEEDAVPSVTNVFKPAEKKEKPAPVPAQEIPVDDREESVEIIESTEDSAEETFEAVKELPAPVEKTLEVQEEYEETEPLVRTVIEAPEVAPSVEETVAPVEELTEEYEDISSVSEGFEAEEDDLFEGLEETAPLEAEEAELGIRVPTGEISYPEYDAYKKRQEEERAADEAEAAKKEDEAAFLTYFSQPKKKTGTKKAKAKKEGSSVTLASCIFALIAIAVIACGAYFIKNTIPIAVPDETTTAESTTEDIGVVATDPTQDETTTEAEETTTEAEETTTEAEETTTESEETTTEAEETTAEVEETTTKATTTKPTTTKPTTTKPTTTKPTTTRPTTTKPTTKPNTTKPATTKPTTTDPYGINDVAVQKPSKYLSKTFTVYATAEGVKLRNKPADNAERILYLSKGGDLTVYAEQGGYYYVRSNRYGVYGWVPKTYTAKERPTADETINTSGTVKCDSKYSKAKTMTTTDGLNLRKGPGKNYGVITVIPKGYPVKVIGEKKGVSGWVYVVDSTYGYAGWMSSDYLK